VDAGEQLNNLSILTPLTLASSKELMIIMLWPEKHVAKRSAADNASSRVVISISQAVW